MTGDDPKITPKQSLWVLTALIIWITSSVLLINQLPTHQTVYPPLIIFSSSLLLLMLLIRLSGNSIRKSCALNTCSYYWVMLAFVLAIGYWFVDQWVMGMLSNAHNNQSIESWRKATAEQTTVTLIATSVVLAPLFEEMLFRGLVLHTVLSKFGPIPAVISSSLLFAIIHWSWPEFVSLIIIGCLYGWLTVKSKSIIPALLAHFIHNVMTFFVYVSY